MARKILNCRPKFNLTSHKMTTPNTWLSFPTRKKNIVVELNSFRWHEFDFKSTGCNKSLEHQFKWEKQIFTRQEAFEPLIHTKSTCLCHTICNIIEILHKRVRLTENYYHLPNFTSYNTPLYRTSFHPNRKGWIYKAMQRNLIHLKSTMTWTDKTNLMVQKVNTSKNILMEVVILFPLKSGKKVNFVSPYHTATYWRTIAQTYSQIELHVYFTTQYSIKMKHGPCLIRHKFVKAFFFW